MEIVIKKATIADAEIIAPLFDGYRIFYKEASNISLAFQFIEERLRNNESVIYIAFENEKAVGFTQLYPIFSSVSVAKAWLLNDLYVVKNARGKGVATMLLDTAKQLGRDTDCKWLLLQTSFDNFTAQSVYEKNEWKKQDLYDYYFYL
jgi:GNAT superfamily N-acetyltransferase